jgi:hypothetical protein
VSYARMFSIFGVLLCIAMTMTASVASADESIAVAPKPVCDPCTIHVVGESSLAAFHVVTVSNCTDELIIEVYSDGSGYITRYLGVNDPPNSCTREQCTAGPSKTPIPWDFDGEEIDVGTVRLTLDTCLTLKASDHSVQEFCNNVPVIVTEQTPGGYQYLFDVSHECTVGGTPKELHAHWQTEATHNPDEETEVELIHGS